MRIDFSDWLRYCRRRKAALPIGIEFASDALYMVQCEGEGSNVRIRAATAIPYRISREALLADEKALRKLVKRALFSAPFEGRRVHTSLPASEVRIIPLTITVSAGQSEQSLVIKALKDKLRSDLSNEVVDYLQVRSVTAGAPETNVLAAVATRDAVLAHLRVFETAGLEPESVDVGPSALTRLLSGMQMDEPEQSVLLINFGIEKSYITVVWGRRLMLDREVQFGHKPLISRLAAALNVEEKIAETFLKAPEASLKEDHSNLIGNDAGRIIDEVLHPQFSILAEEVSRTLVYIASKTHGKATKSIYLNGSLAHYPYIQSKVQLLFDVPVALLNPLNGLQPASPKALSPDLMPHAGFALATGLALRGSNG